MYVQQPVKEKNLLLIDVCFLFIIWHVANFNFTLVWRTTVLFIYSFVSIIIICINAPD